MLLQLKDLLPLIREQEAADWQEWRLIVSDCVPWVDAFVPDFMSQVSADDVGDYGMTVVGCPDPNCPRHRLLFLLVRKGTVPDDAVLVAAAEARQKASAYWLNDIRPETVVEYVSSLPDQLKGKLDLLLQGYVSSVRVPYRPSQYQPHPKWN